MNVRILICTLVLLASVGSVQAQQHEITLLEVRDNPYPVVGDLNRGKRVAEQCQACHGLGGVKAGSGAPFIAGMPQEYLVRSLMAYRDGTRNHKDMLLVSNELDALELADVTAYYSMLTTPWQGAVAGARSKAVLKDKPARKAAEHIVKGCKSCHSLAGRQQGDITIPSLDGMPLEYFVPALKSYFNGGRDNESMALFKGRLNDSDIYNLGAYYAIRKPMKPELLDAGSPAKGKMIARLCAGCHGEDGNSLNPHIPNLAGQPAAYLIKVIKDYRDGRRQAPLMQGPVASLNDANITDLASYYSRQTPRSQLHEDISSPSAFDPLADGERIAASCNTCHGLEGNSTKLGVPNLTGLSVKYIFAATQAYQQGARHHPAMEEIVSFYSDTDIEKVAYYYATRTPQAHKKLLVGDAEAGAALVSACAGCHGELGISPDPSATPSLAGQDARYLISATRAYSEGERAHEGMTDIAKQLTPKEINDLAAYFSSQAPAQVETFLPNDPVYLVSQQCSRCHGEGGYEPRPGVPRLAGQLESYFILAMREYQQGVRKNSVMGAMSHTLSLLEIKAMAAYYAKQ